MADEPRNDKPVTEDEVSDHAGEFEDVNIAAPGNAGGAGGLGYPTHPQGENAADPVEQTLSNGTIGVDVSGVQTGSGNTRMTITPSLSKPKRGKQSEAKPGDRSKAQGSGS
jgi:hypothetical protein